MSMYIHYTYSVTIWDGKSERRSMAAYPILAPDWEPWNSKLPSDCYWIVPGTINP